MKIKAYLGYFLLSIIFLGCSGKGPKETDAELDTISLESDSVRSIPIFYQILMPVEMAKIFEQAGAVYTREILNPVEKVSGYSTFEKMALNLGVYGVDLGYIKMFGDAQNALKYFGTIHKLSMQMGIPEEFFAQSIQRFEKNLTNEDSLTAIASGIYEETDHYLKQSERHDASALIVFGGWVEALYISADLLKQNPQNTEIVNRIASQKYALNTLVNLFVNSNNNLAISEYLLILKGLKDSFDKIEIYFEEGRVELDTIHKTIMSDNYKVKISPETLMEITSSIKKIRENMVK